MSDDSAQVRRQQVMDAVVDVTVEGGLQAATFRTIASRAGISVRLVQYYFGTKDQLLADTVAYVGQGAAQRIAAALQTVPSDSPRAVITTICEQFLPLDDERRRAMIVFIAFRTAALTDPALATSQTLGLADSLIATFEEQVRAGGPRRSKADVKSEAVLLAAAMTGLASMILAGDATPKVARRHLQYAIDRALG